MLICSRNPEGRENISPVEFQLGSYSVVLFTGVSAQMDFRRVRSCSSGGNGEFKLEVLGVKCLGLVLVLPSILCLSIVDKRGERL